MRGSRILTVALLLLGHGLLVAPEVLDRTLGQDVLTVMPRSPAAQELERALWAPGDPVPPLYGEPASQTTRVLVFDESRLIRPPEDPSLVLLSVDRDQGEHPLQVKTVRWAGRIAGVALLSLTGLGLVLYRLLRRRTSAAARA